MMLGLSPKTGMFPARSFIESMPYRNISRPIKGEQGLWNRMVDLTSKERSSEFIAHLPSLFEMVDDDAVNRYVASHPYLHEPLEQIAKYVREFFRLTVKPSLEVWVDQEEVDIRRLVVHIPANDSTDKMVKRLSDFRRTYWLKQPYRIRRDLLIGY